MAKTLSESPLTTRNARAALPLGVHWRRIDPETHLGYRKGKRAGVWLVRWRHGKGYRQAPLGTADDAIKTGTLAYEAAMKAAREFVEKARADALAEAAGPVLTVRSAVEGYIADRDARESRRAGRSKRSDAASRLCRYVIGRPASGQRKAIAAAPLADVALHNLTEKDLAYWRDRLPESLKATTTRRLMNDLKAALNAAHARDRERLPATLPGVVKHALRTLEREDEAEPVARDNQILSDAEIARILKAAREVDEEEHWDGDLFRLVLVLAATGARFSQAARLRIRDFQAKEGRLLIPVSRKGRGGAKAHSVTVPIGADVVATLATIAARRPKDAPLLERWRHVQKPGGMEWRKDRRGAWQSSAEIVRPWQAIRERAGLSEAVAYSLRHSSIVRAIRSNLPLRLIAATHDTSTAMIERHYAKWITSGLEEMVRAALVPLVPDDGDKVVRLAERTKA
jgi:integrase